MRREWHGTEQGVARTEQGVAQNEQGVARD